MATTLYFLDSAADAGTLPTSERSALTETTAGTYSLTAASTTAGTTAVQSSRATAASTTAQVLLLGEYASPAIAAGVTSITLASFGLAISESNANVNWLSTRLNVYVWRPSTSTVVAQHDVDYTHTEALISTTSGAWITGAPNAVLACQAGDRVVVEVFARLTAGMATAYSVGLRFGGSDTTWTAGVTSASPASGIQFSENGIFGAPPIAGSSIEVLDAITGAAAGTAVASGGAPLSFDFSQVNGTALSAIDARWAGPGATTIKTLGGVAVQSAPYGADSAWFAAGQSATQKVQATIKAGDRSTGAYASLLLQVNATQQGYEFNLRPDSAGINIARNGTYLATVSASLLPVATSDNLLRAEYASATGVITLYVNGALAGSTTDPTPLTGGYPGVQLYEAGSTAFAAVDNWTDLVTQAGGPAAITGTSSLTLAAITSGAMGSIGTGGGGGGSVVVDIAGAVKQYWQSGTSFAVTKPTGLAAGDYWFVFTEIDDGGLTSVVPPAGWSLLTTAAYSSVDGGTLHAHYKIATGSEAATETFTSVGRPAALISLRVTGASAIHKFSAQALNTGAITQFPTGGSLTTTTACELLWIAASDYQSQTSIPTWVQPTGYNSFTTHSTGDWNSLAIAKKTQTVAGTESATGAQVSTTGTIGGALSFLVAFSSAGGPATITGTASKTLGGVTASAAAAVRISGTSSLTLGGIAGTSVGSVRVSGASAVTLSGVTGTATGSTTTLRRAISLVGGVRRQVRTSELGTGLKPLVLNNGALKLRATTEGLPVVLANGRLKTLASGETLEI